MKGAIKTDFILSAEIMTIILSNIDAGSEWYFEAAVLGLAALVITLVVYGAVALIVKADDVGLAMAESGRLSATRAVGAAVVKGMPGFLLLLTIVGTAAMIWVGGNILVHALAEIVWHAPYDLIHALAVGAADAVGAARGFVEWFVTALLDGIIGLAVGFVIVMVFSTIRREEGH